MDKEYNFEFVTHISTVNKYERSVSEIKMIPTKVRSLLVPAYFIPQPTLIIKISKLSNVSVYNLIK